MSIEYAYDRNGNLIRDDNKGMTFTYDLLGHPLAIVGSDNQTDYVYSADGRKLRATHTQGNNRILIGSNGQRDQYSHYYPYGGLMGDISTNDPHSYKYGGKELDRDFGIDLFDFEARQFDAKLPAFTSIDPLAEKYYGISPYAYCAGDPVNLVDPTGMALRLIGDSKDCGRFVDLLNKGAGRVVFASEGNMVYMADQNELNTYSQTIADVINSQGTVTIDVVCESSNVLIGDQQTQTVDVGDMEKLNEGTLTSGASAALHEIVEQQYLQLRGATPSRAHRQGLRAEANIRENKAYCENSIIVDENNNYIGLEISCPQTESTEYYYVENKNIIK